MLAIWSLVPLPFLNLAWTSRSLWFMYYWSLAWRILSVTLLACEMITIVWLSLIWHCLSLGLGWKWTFSSPVATAEFSKFAGILSAALSQHHLSGFEIVLTGIPWPPLVLFTVMFPKTHLTPHSKISGSGWVITPSWLPGSWNHFFFFWYSSVYSCHLFLNLLLLLDPYHFCPLLSPSLHEMCPWYL